ncbi:degenerate transposase [Streptococcus pneumoniae]|nr:degenerate transposase [Streptococcus pneumoniae]
MKSDKTIIRKIHMEQLHFITKLLDIKDPNIKILDIINMDTHKEIIAKLDYEAPSCPDCGSLMKIALNIKKERTKFVLSQA